MSTKKALKEIRNKIAGQEYEGALYEATNLLKSIGDKDSDAPTVLAFRGLALTHLERIDEAEKSYLDALRLAPAHNLAGPGLKKLYVQHKSWDKLGSFLELGVQATYDERDGDKVSAAMQELVNHRLKHGPEEKLYDALSLLIPSSPVVPLIQSAAVPSGQYIPLAMPIYPVPAGKKPQKIPTKLPHVYHLAGSLALVLYILIHVQSHIHDVTEFKVKQGRQRIGARSERDVRRQVNAEVLGGTLGNSMIDLLHDVASHPAVEENVRRDVEIQEFNFWCKLVAVLPAQIKKDKPAPAAPKPKAGGMIIGGGAKLPPKPASPPADDATVPELFRTPQPPKLLQRDALARANGLADGFVLLGVGGAAEDAWIWNMDARDDPTISYDLEFLHKFAHTFPNSELTDFIDDYCRLFKLPLPAPEDEGTPPESPGKEHGEEKVQYKKPHKGKKKHLNTRERRKARRHTEREGALAEDVDEEEREELIASMTKLLKSLPTSVFALRVMARVAIQEEDWVNAIAYAEKARKAVKTIESERGIKLPNVQISLDEALGVALVPYYPPKHHERASRLLNGVLKSTPADYEARFAVGQIAQVAGDWEGARGHFQMLLDHGGGEKEMVAAREELGWCLVNEGKLQEGRDVLESVVEVRDTRKEQEGKDDEAPQRARAWWRLGHTEWMIGDAESRTNAEEWFMASLRADSSFAPAYTALGICYEEGHSPPDTERALKCFQKAFELDATEAEAARRLAFGYADDDEWALVRAIATRVMEGEGGVEGVAGGATMNATGRFAPKNGWAWKALGSTEMHYKNYPKAISSYQIALRATPEDASMWRMLGDAYVKSGRHMAGLKALQHALELDGDMWMAQYHIGEVYMQLGAYEKAIEAFDAVEFAIGGTEVGVTAALAEATFALGGQAAAGGFHERSRRAFRDAIQYAARVLDAGRSHRAWAWKLIGDAALLLAEHEATPEDAEATAKILHPVLELLVADDDDRRSNVAGLGHASNLLQSAAGPNHTVKAAVFAFAYRAHLLKNEIRVADSALYDLGCALHLLAISALDDAEKTAATKAAVSAIRLALEREPGEERLWNALGVIASAAGPQLAQHAFVVSLECYAKDPVVWTNLGYLYLRLDDRELANECFLKSQIMDPDYSRAWFGQAVLAERDGQGEQAASLFAHAVTLSAGALLEADLALAIQSFGAYANPMRRDTTALHQPAFALKRYTHSRPRDAAAQHLYALVCERLGLADAAVSALEVAVALLEDEFEATESPEIEANYIVALANLGRVRLSAGQYGRALESYGSCAELATGAQDPRVVGLTSQIHLGTALAHFWLNDLDASLASFQHALDGAKNDNALTDELVVLLARTLWGVGGDEARDAAKTHLMECLEHEEPSVKVIAALGAVALGSSDADLLDAAVSELEGVHPERRAFQDPTGAADLVQFATALSQSDTAGALSALEMAATMNAAPAPRNRLAAAYLADGKSAEAAALLEAKGAADVQDAADADRLRGVAKTLEGEDGIAELQRAVMLAPWDAKAWEALAWAKRALVEVEAEE